MSSMDIIFVGRRHQCVKLVKSVMSDKDMGKPANIRMTKVGWLTWVIEFELKTR